MIRRHWVQLAPAVALTGLLSATSNAHAALVAADSFLDGGSAPDVTLGQYQTNGLGGLGTPINSQAPTVPGFVGSWSPPGASNLAVGWSATSNFLARATGLDLGYGFEQPGAIGYLNTPNDFIARFVQRELDTAAIQPTSTWYMGGIVNSGSDLGANPDDPNDPSSGRKGFAYSGFTNSLTDGRLFRDPDEDPGNIGNLFGVVWGFEYDAVNAQMDLVLRHRQDIGGGDVEPASNVLIDGVTDNTSFAVFLKVDAVAGGADTITYWVNPTGTTEAEFDTTAIATGSLQSFAFNSDANNWNALDPDLNRAVNASGNWNGSLVIDEMRLATTFNDLLGITATLDGDLDGDGFVGIADLNIILGNWNQNVAPGDPLVGDPSGDGFVGIDDLNAVLGNWNAGTPPADAAAVPEPATLALLAMGTLALVRRKR